MTREPAFGAAGPSVVFEYSDAGISATKVFRFQKEGYLLRVEAKSPGTVCRSPTC